MKYTALIVDDEPNAREYLTELVGREVSLEICGTCATGNEAIAFCETLEPDLIFLDIEMPGRSGIETAQVLSNKKLSSIIIFTTAYDQYAIQAFEVAAIGYLLKPFSEEQFSVTVKRAIYMKGIAKKAHFQDRMSHLFERFDQSTPTTIREFILYEKGLEVRVPTEAVEYLIADSEYVEIHTKSRKYLKRLALALLAKQLPSAFVRVHRSIIINHHYVITWSYLNNGTYSFDFQNGTSLKSSRSYKEAVQMMLSNNADKQ
ncbi:MAG: response regulator transcription factor [Cyclobacteriaceae bacterium]